MSVPAMRWAIGPPPRRRRRAVAPRSVDTTGVADSQCCYA
jgi:hypothetical protein